MKCEILHIGTATAILEIGGLRLLTDPVFDPAGTEHRLRTPRLGVELSYTHLSGPAILPGAVGPIDAVLLSHDHHHDNFDLSGRELARSAGRIVTTESGARRLTARGTHRVDGLAPWHSIELQTPAGFSLRITATPARHGPPGSRFVVGDVIGFLLEATVFDHGALWISGDTVWFRGIEEIARRARIGTAILHFGAGKFRLTGPIRYTFSAAEGVRAARSTGTRTVIPIHVSGWSHFSEGRSDIERAFTESGLSDRLHWLVPGVRETIEI